MAKILLSEISSAFHVDGDVPFEIVGDGELPSYFDVTSLAATSIAIAGAMLSRFVAGDRTDSDTVVVDQRLASLWFGLSLRPIGWQLPPIWDAVAGDYPTSDGWIRLHTNAPHHRARALDVLGVEAERRAVARAVSQWHAEALETAIVAAGGCAASMRDFKSWSAHPQGQAVAREPLVKWDERDVVSSKHLPRHKRRPLEGLRVLDLTRVLAGPAATRFLAGFGADVLRIDPPDWDEALAVQEMTLGKRCARLDLKRNDDRAVFETLLRDADVLVHGYRSEALLGLGYGPDQRRAMNPCLIDVCLNAYGWSGPWSGRRGFDSLVQMSSGIADFGMKCAALDKPFPLPVQALDHATGYLMAAAVLQALILRQEQGRVLSARLSLARTARLLGVFRNDHPGEGLPAATDADLDPRIEETVWGPAKRVRFPLAIGKLSPEWPYPAGPLGASPAAWGPTRLAD